MLLPPVIHNIAVHYLLLCSVTQEELISTLLQCVAVVCGRTYVLQYLGCVCAKLHEKCTSTPILAFKFSGAHALDVIMVDGLIKRVNIGIWIFRVADSLK